MRKNFHERKKKINLYKFITNKLEKKNKNKKLQILK